MELISKQTVLELLQMKYSGKDLYRAIYELPSVKNKAEWKNETPLDDEGDEVGCSLYVCSECGMTELWESPFCPSCGADMR